MADYTNRFSEVNVLLDVLDVNQYNGGVSGNWVSVANYHRGVVIIATGNLTGTCDVALWQATNAAGGSAKVVTGKAITQLTAADDRSQCLIEFQTEELDVDNGFDFVRFQTTSSAANDICCLLFGVVPRFPPGATTNWDEVIT